MDKHSKLIKEEVVKCANMVEAKSKLNKQTCLFIRYLRVSEKECGHGKKFTILAPWYTQLISVHKDQIWHFSGLSRLGA